MRFGVEVQGHAAVDAAEPPEVLILHPAARAALEHAQRQPILPDVDVGGQLDPIFLQKGKQGSIHMTFKKPGTFAFTQVDVSGDVI